MSSGLDSLGSESGSDAAAVSMTSASVATLGAVAGGILGALVRGHRVAGAVLGFFVLGPVTGAVVGYLVARRPSEPRK